MGRSKAKKANKVKYSPLWYFGIPLVRSRKSPRDEEDGPNLSSVPENMTNSGPGQEPRDLGTPEPKSNAPKTVLPGEVRSNHTLNNNNIGDSELSPSDGYDDLNIDTEDRTVTHEGTEEEDKTSIGCFPCSRKRKKKRKTRCSISSREEILQLERETGLSGRIRTRMMQGWTRIRGLFTSPATQTGRTPVIRKIRAENFPDIKINTGFDDNFIEHYLPIIQIVPPLEEPCTEQTCPIITITSPDVDPYMEQVLPIVTITPADIISQYPKWMNPIVKITPADNSSTSDHIYPDIIIKMAKPKEYKFIIKEEQNDTSTSRLDQIKEKVCVQAYERVPSIIGLDAAIPTPIDDIKIGRKSFTVSLDDRLILCFGFGDDNKQEESKVLMANINVCKSDGNICGVSKRVKSPPERMSSWMSLRAINGAESDRKFSSKSSSGSLDSDRVCSWFRFEDDYKTPEESIKTKKNDSDNDSGFASQKGRKIAYERSCSWVTLEVDTKQEGKTMIENVSERSSSFIHLDTMKDTCSQDKADVSEKSSDFSDENMWLKLESDNNKTEDDNVDDTASKLEHHSINESDDIDIKDLVLMDDKGQNDEIISMPLDQENFEETVGSSNREKERSSSFLSLDAMDDIHCRDNTEISEKSSDSSDESGRLKLEGVNNNNEDNNSDDAACKLERQGPSKFLDIHAGMLEEIVESNEPDDTNNIDSLPSEIKNLELMENDEQSDATNSLNALVEERFEINEGNNEDTLEETDSIDSLHSDIKDLVLMENKGQNDEIISSMPFGQENFEETVGTSNREKERSSSFLSPDAMDDIYCQDNAEISEKSSDSLDESGRLKLDGVNNNNKDNNSDDAACKLERQGSSAFLDIHAGTLQEIVESNEPDDTNNIYSLLSEIKDLEVMENDEQSDETISLNALGEERFDTNEGNNADTLEETNSIDSLHSDIKDRELKISDKQGDETISSIPLVEERFEINEGNNADTLEETDSIDSLHSEIKDLELMDHEVQSGSSDESSLLKLDGVRNNDEGNNADDASCKLDPQSSTASLVNHSDILEESGSNEQNETDDKDSLHSENIVMEDFNFHGESEDEYCYSDDFEADDEEEDETKSLSRDTSSSDYSLGIGDFSDEEYPDLPVDSVVESETNSKSLHGRGDLFSTPQSKLDEDFEKASLVVTDDEEGELLGAEDYDEIDALMSRVHGRKRPPDIAKYKPSIATPSKSCLRNMNVHEASRTYKVKFCMAPQIKLFERAPYEPRGVHPQRAEKEKYSDEEETKMDKITEYNTGVNALSDKPKWEEDRMKRWSIFTKTCNSSDDDF